MSDVAKVRFGRTGLEVSRLAIGSSYGVGGADLERAFERGVNFMFWGLRRTPQFARGLQPIIRGGRERLVIAIQSYSRSATLMKHWADCALRRLGTDYVDILTLGWWNDVPPNRILDAARSLQEAGKVRHVMISCHHRPTFEKLVADPTFGAIMVRYNAAHPGAETEVFPHLRDPKPGVLAFTVTRWGTLLRPELTPEGERTPTAPDCYRFVLASPHVDVSLCGPADGRELDMAVDAAARGPLSEDEMAWIRRVGVAVRRDAKTGSPVDYIDRLANRFKRRAHAGA